MTLSRQAQKLTEMLGPTITALGYELWGIEYLSRGRDSVLRIYIDSVEGITVDDCARVSHQVSGLLDVEDPIQGEYNLEVSSPGLDRPLFYLSQYENFKDCRVHIRLAEEVKNRRKFSGTLLGVKENSVEIMVDKEVFVIDFDKILKAHVEIA